MHERALLGKVGNMEEKVNSYLNNLSNAVEEVRQGNEAKIPAAMEIDVVRTNSAF